MRVARITAALLLPLGLWAANPDFERGMKALADKDYATALGYLEQALKAEPDNLQFGSEYRQALLKQAKALHPKEGAPGDWDRGLKFFETLTAANPKASAAWL